MTMTEIDNVTVRVDAVITDEQYREAMSAVRAASERMDLLEAENAKLRKLCVSLYEFAMSEYPDGTELNFADRLRELGVEVDE